MIKKKDILKNLKNTYCRLKPSKINGVGVFAIREIPRGVNPFQVLKKEKWYTFKISDFKNFDKEILKMVDDFFVIEKGGKVSIPDLALNGMNISFFLNNSEKPNLKPINGGLFFKTIRKIKKGEELTTSYKDYDWKYKQ